MESPGDLALVFPTWVSRMTQLRYAFMNERVGGWQGRSGSATQVFLSIFLSIAHGQYCGSVSESGHVHLLENRGMASAPRWSRHHTFDKRKTFDERVNIVEGET